MGNRKFKLSDMIPNAWFYKLKDMNKTSSFLKKHHLPSPPPPPPAPPSSPPIFTVKPLLLPPSEPQGQSRKSYHISRELTTNLQKEVLILKSPPRKSKSRKSSRRSSSISTCSSQSPSTFQSYRSASRSSPSPPPTTETDVINFPNNNVGFFLEDALLKFKEKDTYKQSILKNALTPSLTESEHFDIVIDAHNKFGIQLPPIITKKETKLKNTVNKDKQKPVRRMTVSSPGGVRLKVNSPKIIGRKQGQNGNKNVGRRSTSTKKKKGISESFAVVKSSFNPQRDFKESMVEMILQNNLTAAKDLEELLACYLSLNSDEYHDVIIKVFKQIWIDLRHPK